MVVSEVLNLIVKIMAVNFDCRGFFTKKQIFLLFLVSDKVYFSKLYNSIDFDDNSSLETEVSLMLQ